MRGAQHVQKRPVTHGWAARDSRPSTELEFLRPPRRWIVPRITRTLARSFSYIISELTNIRTRWFVIQYRLMVRLQGHPRVHRSTRNANRASLKSNQVFNAVTLRRPSATEEKCYKNLLSGANVDLEEDESSVMWTGYCSVGKQVDCHENFNDIVIIVHFLIRFSTPLLSTPDENST